MTTWLAVAFKLISSCLTLVEPYITLTVAAEGHAQCMADGIASEGFYSEPPP